MNFDCYRGMKVLVTGHTGFKGTWLSLWLKKLGAEVIGYSLPPSTNPSNFALTGLCDQLTHIEGDIRDFEILKKVMLHYQPEVVFHLAAQPIVLTSFSEPKETFDVNVGGTVNVLEAAKLTSSVQAMVLVTSDKCYDNQEWLWGYRETDRLGGSDPYSASKAMAELAISSYRASLMIPARCGRRVGIASARAGNVIGGGDFSPHRLVPDSMKALIADQPISVRNPNSIRPWLHVLEPLSGYLLLGKKLLENGLYYSDSWNFGPQDVCGVSVAQMVEKAIEIWGSGSWVDNSSPDVQGGEMGLLRLNWDKAANKLGWRPQYTWDQALAETVYWFKEFRNSGGADHSMESYCIDQIERYEACAMASVPC